MSVEGKVKAIISDIFKVDASNLNRDTDFVKDLKAKSLDMIELIAMLEIEFDIEIPELEVRGNRTVGEATDWMEKKLKQK